MHALSTEEEQVTLFSLAGNRVWATGIKLRTTASALPLSYNNHTEVTAQVCNWSIQYQYIKRVVRA